ncbi:MAG: superoxide dismutase family protein [Pseudooceanicola sp.]
MTRKLTHRIPPLAGIAALARRAMIGAGLLAGLGAPAMAQDGSTETTFVNAEGQEIGTATLTDTQSGVLIELDLRDLPPETWHGFHVHENGECDPQNGFKSAGGHYAITGTKHGFLVDGGPHAGDMPNQFVAADGTLKAQVLNTYVFLGGESGNITGRALMIHGGADDYESQSSGDAGERIACAVVE